MCDFPISLPEIGLLGCERLAASFQTRFPRDDFAVGKIVVADHGKLGAATRLAGWSVVDHFFHQACGRSLLVAEDQLDGSFANSCRILPVEGVILAEPLAPLCHAHRAMEVAQFFHLYHRVFCAVLLVAELKLIHHQRFVLPCAAEDQEAGGESKKSIHKAQSNSLLESFKKQPAARVLSRERWARGRVKFRGNPISGEDGRQALRVATVRNVRFDPGIHREFHRREL
jgi:hypothetical protein